MTIPSFEDQQAAWSSPPVDGIGYLSSAELLTYGDEDLRVLVKQFEAERYGGERNHDNTWRDTLALDTTHGCRVLDYGCGVGVEALQYAKTGNEVWVADIAPSNAELACHVLSLHGYRANRLAVGHAAPFVNTAHVFDVVHCSGVLHHIPHPRPVVERFAELLVPGGELRLMLYSDVGWQLHTGTEPPEDVADDPSRNVFVRKMDDVGEWADWYNHDRLVARFGDLFDVERVEYLMPNRSFLAAVLRKPLS